MDEGKRPDARELRIALLNEMLHALELLEALIARFKDSQLTPDQKAAFDHWEKSLPGLREGLKVMYTSHFVTGAS